MSKSHVVLILFAFCLVLQSCGSSQRFMNFGWDTPKPEVLDSIQDWGFKFNTDKQRWEKGTLNGFACSKLKVWFSDKDLLAGAEAKYLDLDTETSASIRDRFVGQLRSLHGDPEAVRIGTGSIEIERLAWSFSKPEAIMQDMIVLTRFPDYVIVHAARNMPKLFDLAPSLED